ncbi:unnamed protein product, partial [Owenia fusiformis]
AEVACGFLRLFYRFVDTYSFTLTMKARKSRGEKLARFRQSVEQLSTNTEEDPRFQDASVNKKSRKDQRKEDRKMKKARKNAFMHREPMPVLHNDKIISPIELEKINEKKREKRKKERTRQKAKKIRQKESEAREAEELKKQGLIEANKQEDKVIKQLEKQMKLNKRKGKGLPASFIDDGLDFILDACDSEKLTAMLDADDIDSDLDVDLENKLQESEGESDDDRNESDDNESDNNESESNEDARSDNDESESNANSDENDESEKDNDSEENMSENDSSDNDPENDTSQTIPNKKPTKTKASVMKEDIYGRLRDVDGNLVTGSTTIAGSYVPPGKRLKLEADNNQATNIRLKKQLKGLVNRLSEANMQGIGGQIEGLYRANSRASINETLLEIVLDACIGPSLTPERLAMEMCMLVAYLHITVGNELAALLLQSLVKQLDEQFLKSDAQISPTKEVHNMVILLCHMYSFGLVGNVLVYDLIRTLTERFNEIDIELVLLVMKHVGFTLRKDDAMALKEVMLKIQVKVSEVNRDDFQDRSRVGFMLETLQAIKNNNMRKIPNYDPSHMEHLRKLLRNYTKGSSSNPLRISLEDLRSAENKGKWWVVGSAWEGRAHDTSTETSVTPIGSQMSDNIQELARKLRMNTDVRKGIFSIIMTSEDYIDAFEKLLRLGLKQQQESEIIHVIVECCCQEKKYNPYYGYLLQKLCEYDRRFMMTFQFHMWDRFQTISGMSEQNLHNLSTILTHLLATKAVSLSIFKEVEFGELQKAMVKFIKMVCTSLLLNYDNDVIEYTFKRIASQPNLHMLREGLRLFIRHFLVKSKALAEQRADLESKVKVLEKALSSAEVKMRL